MIKVLLGTGHNRINKTLFDLLKLENEKNGEVVFDIHEKFVHYKEGVSGTINEHNSDILITSDLLEGSSLTRESFIQEIRAKNPNTRIIYLLNEDDERSGFEKFLYSLSVFDVIKMGDGVATSEILRLIYKKKEWKDVYFHFREMTSEQIYALNKKAFTLDSKAERKLSNGFERFILDKEEDEDLLLQITSFWSIRAQSGSTFLATNTALLLSQNANSKTLLVDFNLENPNIHLQMTLTDNLADKNYAALYQDLLIGEINLLSDLGKYLIKHPFHKNLDILPGAILDNLSFKTNNIKDIINYIIKYAKKYGYTTVIFDVSPGFSNEHIKFILDSSDKIIMPFLETPGSIITFQKFFDKHGPFFESLLNVNKLFPVMNQTTESATTSNFSEIASSVIHRSVYAHIPRKDEIHYSVANGVPLLNNTPDPLLKREFIDIANCIHNVFLLDESTIKSNQTLSERNKKGLFWK